MTPQEALQFLSKVLVTKSGLSVEGCASVVVAWNTLAAAVAPPPQLAPKPDERQRPPVEG